MFTLSSSTSDMSASWIFVAFSKQPSGSFATEIMTFTGQGWPVSMASHTSFGMLALPYTWVYMGYLS